MDKELIIIVSVFGAAWLVVFVMAITLCALTTSLRRTVREMRTNGRIRVQKLKMKNDKNHAFQNPALAPDEELSRRGYSMYMPDDVESARGTVAEPQRQTGGQFVEELTREIDYRQQRQSSSPAYQEDRFRDEQYNDPRSMSDSRNFDPRAEQRSTAPPFLLQAIEENKRKSRLANPVANGGRQSNTNPNFIY